MGLSNIYIETLLSKNIPNKSTSENYIVRLNKLSSLLNKPIYDIIKSTNMNDIQILYPNPSTQKNVITVILSVFKYIPELSQKKPMLLKKWRAIHDELSKTEKSRPDISSDESPSISIKQKYQEYKKPIESLSASQEYLLLSIATHSPNQLIDFSKRPTKGKITAPSDLADDILESVKQFPRPFIFVDKSGQGFKSNNSFTVYVSRTFHKLFGKKIGINDLK